ncbi:hypothetical protein BDZ90DRAFT_282034 [Jaminaea rosea]|uniref:N-acetyltransferase domain-containing protein n=1 Tax=Jaminaea rosea TaxID=1569628 RepID=A0A316UIK5_9BASI|nr:hypothetical protein BDZ90DRAFT_282034 [Jaminaea rosea]PWN24698.1 hypothetical protein BDZ90DRAFT_282034 [Jaminaea rosea]
MPIDADGNAYTPYWPVVTITPPSGRFIIRSGGLSRLEVESFRAVIKDQSTAKYLPPRTLNSDEEIEKMQRDQVIAPWDHRRTFDIWQGDDMPGRLAINYLQLSPDHEHLPGPERPILLAQMGVAMDSRFSGRGIAKEAFLAVLDFGFESMGVPLFQFGTEERNLAMRGILERPPLSLKPMTEHNLDAEQAKVVAEWGKHSLVMVCYQITREEWQQRLRGAWQAHFKARHSKAGPTSA